jgi:hypothetical protein
MAIPSTGFFIVLSVSHGLVTSLKNVLRTMNEYEGTLPFPTQTWPPLASEPQPALQPSIRPRTCLMDPRQPTKGLPFLLVMSPGPASANQGVAMSSGMIFLFSL